MEGCYVERTKKIQNSVPSTKEEKKNRKENMTSWL